MRKRKLVIIRRRQLRLIIMLTFISLGSLLLAQRLLNPEKARAGWWDDLWSYRNNIQITNDTTPETNVYTIFNLDTSTLISANKMQSDCGDLRFTSQTGNLLKYYLVSDCDTASTVIHLLHPSFPSGQQTFYYYYGNPLAADGTSASDFSTQASSYTVGSTGSEEVGSAPIAYWSLDDSYGTVAHDRSGSVGDGTLGSGGSAPSWKSESYCVAGTCLEYDGTDDYVGVAATANYVETVSFWVRPITTSEYLIDLDGGTHTISVTSGTISAGGFDNPTIYVNGQVGNSLVANLWQQITVTTATAITGSSISLGKIGTDHLQGFLDEVKFYDYVRTAGQISSDYSALVSGQGTVQGVSAALGSPNAGFTVSNGLVGYYKMDAAAGTTSPDYSGNGHTGTLGSGGSAPTWVNGKFGNGLEFVPGSSQYVSVGSTIGGIMTISFWVNPDNTTDYYLDLDGSANIQSSSGTLSANSLSNPTIYVNGSPSDSIAADTWSLVTVVADTAIDATSLRIGKAGSNFFDGTMDDLRLYNRALTPSEVRALSESVPSPIVHLKMDEGSGTTAYDSSVNGNNAALGSGDSSPSWATGHYGSSLYFDGSTDIATVSDNNSLDITGNLTLEGWVNQAPIKPVIESVTPSVQNSDSTSYSITMPDVRPSGDLYIAWVVKDDNDAFTVVPGNWQEINVEASSTTVNTGLWYWWGTTEPASYTLEADSEQWSGAVLRISGANASAPINQEATATVGTDATAEIPEVTPDVDNSLLLAFAGIDNDWWDTTGQYPSTWNGLFTQDSNDSAENGSANAIGASKSGTKNVASGAGTFTANGSDEWLAITIAIAPIAPAAAIPFGKGRDAYQLELSSAGGITGYINTTSTVTGTIANGWHHVAMVYNGTSQLLYVDGQQVDSTALSAATGTNATDLTLGQTLSGWLDDIKVYNYARSPGQVLEDMLGEHPAETSPLIYYKFDRGTGSTAYNSGLSGSSLKGNFGAASSAPSWRNNGKFGKALNFDGTNDYVTTTITDPGYFNSISLWLSPVTDIASKTIITNLTTDSSSRPVYGNCTGHALTLNQWTHLVVVSDGSGSCQLYQNGLLTARSTTGVTYGTTVNIGNASYAGLIDEFKFYTYPLTSRDALLDYNYGGSLVLGQSTGSSGSTAPGGSKSQEYCVPGSTSPCSPPVCELNLDDNDNSSTLAIDTSEYSTLPLVTSNNNWVPGKYGSGIRTYADTARDDVAVADPADGHLDFSNLQSFSYEFWFKYIGNAVDYLVPLYKGAISNGTAGYDYEITVSTLDSKCKYADGDGTGNDQANLTGAPILDGKWHYVSCVMDRSGVINGTPGFYQFMDGVLVASDTDLTESDGSGSTASLAVGEGNDSYDYDSIIDEVKIFNYARTSAQVAWDYNRGAPYAWWRLDECSGNTTNDASGNGFTGTISIGATLPQTSVGTCDSGSTASAWYNGSSGKYSASLNFDGQDDYVSIGSTATYIKTLSFWAKPSSTTQKIIQLSASDSVEISSGTVSVTGFGTETVYVDGRPSSNFPDTNWHFVTVVSDTNLTAGQIYFGRIGSNYYSGKLDDIKIFNYALTSTQIKTLYNNGSASFGS